MVARLPLFYAVVLCAVLSVPPGTDGLANAQTQPRITSGVDAIRIDASVTDQSGRPIADLTADDFSVRVDGKPRPVTFARFFGTAHDKPADPTSPSGSFATNVSSSPGRIVVFVVDVESLLPGHEKVLLASAASIVEGLSPSDAVGLMLLPGKSIDLTRQHKRVTDALKAVVGAASTSGRRRSMSLDEAGGFDRDNALVISQVVERECRPNEPTCRRELQDQAKEMLAETTRRVRMVVPSLAGLIGRLREIDAPKSIVLLSGGLPFTQDNRGDFRELQRQAAAGGASVYVVKLDQPQFDASSRMSQLSLFGSSDLDSGLSELAGAADAPVFHGVGRGTGTFERIRSDVLNFYTLAIDARPGDLDNERHKIEVRVLRPGATVRSRKELILAGASTAQRSPVDVLLQPLDALEIPLIASAYTTRGDQAETVRVIVLLEGPGRNDSTLKYAFSILQEERTVFETADVMKAVRDGGAAAAVAVQLAPGRYRLRAAIIDANNRAGSLETPLTIGIRQGMGVQLSDLMAGTIKPGGESFSPGTSLPSSSPLAALLEVYGNDPAVLQKATGQLELRRAGEPAILKTAPMAVSPTALEGHRLAQGEIDLTGIAPGRYDLSAVVSDGSRPIGKVTRRIEVVSR